MNFRISLENVIISVSDAPFKSAEESCRPTLSRVWVLEVCQHYAAWSLETFSRSSSVPVVSEQDSSAICHFLSKAPLSTGQSIRVVKVSGGDRQA